MSTHSLPPIVKVAERLLVEIEQAVIRFHRKHKYALGARLRDQAFEICAIAHRAFRDKERRSQWVAKLVWIVDELKLSMQLGSCIKAFASFAQFESLSRTVVELGKQVGGWNRQLHPKGQNARAVNARSQRAKILSTPAASLCEANP